MIKKVSRIFVLMICCVSVLGLSSCKKAELTTTEYYEQAVLDFNNGKFEDAEEKIAKALNNVLSTTEKENFEKLSRNILINKNAKTVIELAEQAIIEEEYESAISMYKNISKEYADYESIQLKIKEIEEIIKKLPITKREQREKDKKEEQKRAEEKAEADKLLKQSQGVEIGMTTQDVIESSWGRPSKINKTTTAYGVSEQWSYYGNKYLYFENDILVTIQE